MVRKTLLVVGGAVVLVLATVSTAVAAPPAITLSSYAADTVGGVVAGGTRSISVTNTTASTLTDHRVDLGPAPCDCVVTDAPAGTIVDNTWLVGDVRPGETVEITVIYGPPPTATLGSTSPAWMLTAIGALLLVLAAVSRRAPKLAIRPTASVLIPRALER
ncbi:MAG: hypothetical protein R2823_06005 [Acidimicrobiia bacterium]